MIQQQKKMQITPLYRKCIRKKEQTHRKAILKVVNCKVCPRILNYYQEMLTMSYIYVYIYI